MKKKVLALISAAALTLLNSMTVLADSPTVGQTQLPVPTQTALTTVNNTANPEHYAVITATSEGFKVSAVSQTTADAAVVAVQNTVLRDVAALGYFLGDANLVQAATTQGELVTASILSTVDVDPVTATKDPVSGMYNVVLTNAQIAAGDTIAILHYNETTKVWELIKPLAVGQGSVAFQSASLSPITIVKVNTTTAAQAPKTGAMPYGVVTMILIGLMGAVICYRNYRRA